MSEYSGANQSGSSCNYSALGTYQAGYSMDVQPQGKVTSGVYMVPTWDAISYNSLTSDVPSCSGYSSIESAYGSGAGSCQTTYTTSLCGGGNNQAGQARRR
jgi:hypothetical protein